MKSNFNEAVINNTEELKGGTLFLLSYLFHGYSSKSYGYSSKSYSSKSYGYSSKKSKW